MYSRTPRNLTPGGRSTSRPAQINLYGRYRPHDKVYPNGTYACLTRATYLLVMEGASASPRRCQGSVVEYCQRSVVINHEYGLGIPALGRTPHARCVDRHARDCEAHHRWGRVDESTNSACRHVPLDHIAFDNGCMACACFDWNSQGLLVAGQVVVLGAFYFCSVVLQVPDPACAASSAGGLVHVDGNTLENTRKAIRRGLCR